MTPINLNLKPKRPSRILLLGCLLGVVAVAWWAWAAGPIRNSSKPSPNQKVYSQPALSKSGYSTASPAQTAASAAAPSTSAAVSAPPASSQSVSQPSNMLCRPLSGGIQPDIAYPCGCYQGTAAIYPSPCCQAGLYQCGCGGGAMIACPERL